MWSELASQILIFRGWEKGFTKLNPLKYSQKCIKLGKGFCSRSPREMTRSIFVETQNSHRVPGQGTYCIKDHYEKHYEKPMILKYLCYFLNEIVNTIQKRKNNSKLKSTNSSCDIYTHTHTNSRTHTHTILDIAESIQIYTN